MNKERNSNHELMRIVSMFLIVLGHVLYFGGLLETDNTRMRYLYNLLEFVLIIHVDSYVLLTGYYQSKTKFKQKKLWGIINSSWFYRIVIVLAFSYFGLINIGKVEFIKNILPVTLDNYWFIKCYILLYCLSPFLNKLIDSLNAKQFKRLIIVGFIINSIIPTITGGEFFLNNGYTLYNFIYLYLLGAYIRKYPIDKSSFFNKFSKKKVFLIMITVFILCVLLNFLIYIIGGKIENINKGFELISIYIKRGSLAYTNPLIIIQAVAYFYIFTNISIKSKLINKISGLMLGVYMIHCNDYVTAYIYKWLGIVDGNYNSIRFIINIFGAAILIFVVCSIIEYIRQILFRFIYKRKLSCKIREKYYNLCKKIIIAFKGMIVK